MEIQEQIDKIAKEFRNKYKKEWFDIVDGEALGIAEKIIEDIKDKEYEVLGKQMTGKDIRQVLMRSKIYWSEVLARQTNIYMYKSLVEGMQGVLRGCEEGDIKSVKLLADLLLKGKLNKLSESEEVEEIFEVGDEELKTALRQRNEDE